MEVLKKKEKKIMEKEKWFRYVFSGEKKNSMAMKVLKKKTEKQKIMKEEKWLRYVFSY